MSRNYRLELRLSKEEYDALETAVAKQQLSKSNYIRIKLFKVEDGNPGIRNELVSLRAEVTLAIAHFKSKNDDKRYEELINSLSGCKEKICELIRLIEVQDGDNDS